MSVVQLSRRLSARPAPTSVEGVRVRPYAGSSDIGPLLELREAAYAARQPAVRTWTRRDFEAEILAAPWWDPDRMWLAEPLLPSGGSALSVAEPLLGSVILALRSAEVPVVHWLTVRPACRRRGIGRLLLTHLEQAAWDAGHREICLETHRGWTDAEQFYAAAGYEAARRAGR